MKISNENENYTLHFIFHTKKTTYQIIKDPCNEKQCQHKISSYGETIYLTQNMILLHDYSSRTIYLRIYIYIYIYIYIDI